MILTLHNLQAAVDLAGSFERQVLNVVRRSYGRQPEGAKRRGPQCVRRGTRQLSSQVCYPLTMRGYQEWMPEYAVMLTQEHETSAFVNIQTVSAEDCPKICV